MLTIKRRIFRGKGFTEHNIYTLEEAKSGVFTEPYMYWKDVKMGDEGKWAMSDDGYIGQILDVKQYKLNKYSKRVNIFVRLTYAPAFVRENAKINFEERRALNSYSTVKAMSWEERLVRAKRNQLIISVIARMTVSGKLDYERIGQLYRPDHPDLVRTGRMFVRIKTVKQKVMAEIEDILKSKGLDREYLAEKAVQMIDMALDARDVKSGAKMLEVAGKWLGMEAPKVKETRQLESHESINAITQAISQHNIAKAKQTIERTGHDDRAIGQIDTGMPEQSEVGE